MLTYGGMLIGLAVGVGSMTTDLAAQEVPSGARSLTREQEAERCRAAIESLESGSSQSYRRVTKHPDASRRAWAAGSVRTCGMDGDRALAAALRRTSRETGSAALDQLTLGSRGFRGPAVYQAAAAIAEDRAASGEARVLALRTLTWLVEPGFIIRYEHYAGTKPGGACSAALGRFEGDVVSFNVPPGIDADIVALARRLHQDPSSPKAVRHAAMCTIANVTMATRKRE